MDKALSKFQSKYKKNNAKLQAYIDTRIESTCTVSENKINIIDAEKNRVLQAKCYLVGIIIREDKDNLWKWGWNVQNTDIDRSESLRIKALRDSQSNDIQRYLKSKFILKKLTDEYIVYGIALTFMDIDYIYETKLGPGDIYYKIGLKDLHVLESTISGSFMDITKSIGTLSFEGKDKSVLDDIRIINPNLRVELRGIPTKKICDYCKKSSKEEQKVKMYNCGRCQLAIYCSRDCQVKHWPTHKINCCQPKVS